MFSVVVTEGHRHRYHHHLSRVGMVRRSLPAEENCPPRNESLAAELGLTCTARCYSDSGCQNKRKLCLCVGPCGLSCIRPEKECPELADPHHGQVHLTGRHFQARAVYTCDPGYQLVGPPGADGVVCQTSGEWSGATPVCQRAPGKRL